MVQLYADAVHLDKGERQAFTTSPIEYLTETVQRTSKVLAGIYSATAPETGDLTKQLVYQQIDLDFTLPVKELFWVFGPEPKATPYQDLCNNSWLQFFYHPNPEKTSLRLNGNTVFENESPLWFRLEQPIQFHSNVPVSEVYENISELPENFQRGI